MAFPRQLSILANKLNLSGTLTPQGGGTGVTTPGTSGNALVSDGTNWVSGSPAQLTTTNYTIKEDGGELSIYYGATKIFAITSTGAVQAKDNVTGYTTP